MGDPQADMTTRASWWSVTLNNPTDDDDTRLKNRPTWVKRLKYQLEQGGEEGTPHYQIALQTTQTRMSQVKQWLPRAHIEVARDKNALLKYCEKADTAVDGTQVDIKTEFLTMDKALMEIASLANDITELYMPEDATNLELKRRKEEWIREEYWQAVNQILLEKPSTVGLFTNPQLERAWVKTRQTWISIKDRQDRQTTEVEA